MIDTLIGGGLAAASGALIWATARRDAQLGAAMEALHNKHLGLIWVQNRAATVLAWLLAVLGGVFIARASLPVPPHEGYGAWLLIALAGALYLGGVVAGLIRALDDRRLAIGPNPRWRWEVLFAALWPLMAFTTIRQATGAAHGQGPTLTPWAKTGD